MRRFRPVLTLLLVAGCLGIWLIDRGGGESAPPGEVERVEADGASSAATRLEGRAAEAPRPAGTLEGTLRSAAGLALSKARVHLLAKDAAKAFPSAEVGENESWSLGDADPRGCWIVALDERHLPVHVDGDAWDGRSVDIVLRAGREVTVEIVTANRRAPGGTQLDMTPVSVDAAPRVPGPGQTPAFVRTCWCSGVGEIRLRVPTAGPVRVHAEARGHVALPADQVVPADVERVRVEFVRACRLSLAVKEAGTERPPIVPVRVAVVDLSTGRPPPASPEARRRDDVVVDAHYLLRAGGYAVTVEAEGYLPWSDAEVLLARPGSRASRDVQLKPDPQAGTLVLRMETVALRPSPVADPFVMAHRPSCGWRAMRLREEDQAAGRLVLSPLVPGRWEFLVWAGASRVGTVSAVVHAGRSDEVGVSVGPGLRVPLRASREDRGVFYSDGGGGLPVTLTTPSGASLPNLWWADHQPFGRAAGSPWVPQPLLGPSPPVGATLGPYPYEEIVVVEGVVGGEGERRTVRAE